MYARFFDGGNSISELEFVFAEHEDYSFNYETEELMGNGDVTLSLQAFKEMVDQPEQRIRIVKIYRGFTSYAEAQKFLNHQTREMVSSLPLEIC